MSLRFRSLDSPFSFRFRSCEAKFERDDSENLFNTFPFPEIFFFVDSFFPILPPPEHEKHPGKKAVRFEGIAFSYFASF